MSSALEPKIDRGAAPASSDRSFGLVFAVVFALIGSWPLWHAEPPRWWAAGIAAAFALTALVRPGILHPLNRAWLALGRLLHLVVSPLVMGAICVLWGASIGGIMRVRRMEVLWLG